MKKQSVRIVPWLMDAACGDDLIECKTSHSFDLHAYTGSITVGITHDNELLPERWDDLNIFCGSVGVLITDGTVYTCAIKCTLYTAKNATCPARNTIA